KRNTETPWPVRLAPAEQEKQDPDQQHKAPEYGRRIFDHSLEAATSLCAEQNERQRNGALQQQGIVGGSGIFVPSSKPRKRPKVITQGQCAASTGKDSSVERAKCCDADDESENVSPHIAEHGRNGLHHDGIGLPQTRQTQ